MSGNDKRPLVPRLRFPEFQDAGEWGSPTLGEISEPVEERVGERQLTPVSISAGIGFVPQAEKFGRDISGNQYKLYTVVRDGDFVYNKGNSLKFPQGCVYDLQGWGEVAAPNVFICFRLKNGYENGFYRQCFEGNAHGTQLRKYITSGARSNGLLNISKNAFWGVRIPTPGHAEQQKIADCLSSLDDLIAAESLKLDVLKINKKGLMRKIFPRKRETIPQFRFPEFRDEEEWKSDFLGNIFETTSGGTPSRSVKEYWDGDIPWITTSLVDFRIITNADEFISEEGLKNSSAKRFPQGTVLIAMYGQGKTRGQVALLGIEAATNQACAAILPRKEIDPYFVFLNLADRYEELRLLSNSGGQENLSQGLIRVISFSYPSNPAEQRTIITCLISLDNFIIEQTQKIEALKIHKKGLMQRLFPRLYEVSA
ncbi:MULTISPECIES: restriction endonuclease subunit S [Gammaproteobacteria]|uniref:restriction endonuclease subunit S n=1 Tax=Gammaproteobacteria TaxID=1236 RepID=UPI00191C8F88|nr:MULTISPECIES: restriction endonuclease subunit S [Gammaproteobacteria]